MYDVIVVGARCAGSPLAMRLARSGHRVLMVDRATFPSDTMSTHFIQSPGMIRLARWGLVDKLWEAGTPPVGSAYLQSTETSMEIDFNEYPGFPEVSGLASPRRTILDKILVDAALEAGAELAERVTISSLLRDGDRVIGVEGHTPDGSFRAEAKFVVGADGRHSFVASAVDAEFRRIEPEKACGYYSYFSGVDIFRTEIYTTDDTICAAFPTNDGLFTVAVEWIGRDMKEVRGDVDKHFLSTLDTLGEIGPKVQAGERAAQYVGLADIDNFLRQAHGPGWALVGDACYFKDPAPADGISDAFRGADFLADALDDILTGRAEEQNAFARYQERQDELAVPLLDHTVTLAAVGTPSQKRLESFIEIRMLTEMECMSLVSEQEVGEQGGDSVGIHVFSGV